MFTYLNEYAKGVYAKIPEIGKDRLKSKFKVCVIIAIIYALGFTLFCLYGTPLAVKEIVLMSALALISGVVYFFSLSIDFKFMFTPIIAPFKMGGRFFILLMLIPVAMMINIIYQYIAAFKAIKYMNSER